MSKLSVFFIGMCSFVFCAAVSLASGVTDPVTNEQWVLELMTLIGGVSGMSQMAVIAAVVQLLMRLFKTPLGEYAGRWRLVIVSGLTFLGALIAGIASGSSLIGILLSGAVLTSMQVFVNQLYKQFKTKAD